ncbi:MAG: hypothetical protein WD002_00595 [Pseudomonadales bacterium]
MAVSFVIRRRRQLAVIPFIIILVVPVLLGTLIWLERRSVADLDLDFDTNTVETMCGDADTLASPDVEGCHFATGDLSTD